jgi:hypothetical protein
MGICGVIFLLNSSVCANVQFKENAYLSSSFQVDLSLGESDILLVCTRNLFPQSIDFGSVPFEIKLQQSAPSTTWPQMDVPFCPPASL